MMGTSPELRKAFKQKKIAEENKPLIRNKSFKKKPWLKEKAPDKKKAVAPADLEVMVPMGKGLPMTDKQAAFWQRKAAEQGDAAAQILLFRVYVALLPLLLAAALQ